METSPFPVKGQIIQSAKGPRRVVLYVENETIFYRTVGKSSSNRFTDIGCWRQWCDDNLAFLIGCRV